MPFASFSAVTFLDIVVISMMQDRIVTRLSWSRASIITCLNLCDALSVRRARDLAIGP
jgi:hypothetical protein